VYVRGGVGCYFISDAKIHLLETAVAIDVVIFVVVVVLVVLSDADVSAVILLSLCQHQTFTR
jgi:hypothetical protein